MKREHAPRVQLDHKAWCFHIWHGVELGQGDWPRSDLTNPTHLHLNKTDSYDLLMHAKTNLQNSLTVIVFGGCFKGDHCKGSIVSVRTA